VRLTRHPRHPATETLTADSSRLRCRLKTGLSIRTAGIKTVEIIWSIPFLQNFEPHVSDELTGMSLKAYQYALSKENPARSWQPLQKKACGP
jgi:hypothetical protein